MTAFLEGVLQRALDKPSLRIERASSVAGGCIHAAQHLRTSEGEFFAKSSLSCAPDIFVCEAEGLKALRAARSDLIVPRVIAATEPRQGNPALLILEYLYPQAADHPRDEEKFGRALAAVHRHTSARFGFESPSYCGSTRQDNSPRDSWVDFYRDCRLTPLVTSLERKGVFSSEDRRMYERLMVRLDDLVPRDTVPSLIHGDLWSGNVLWSDRGPALVDPACAYNDREMEFGITTLFGGMSQRAFAAYEETWPLPPGWRDRNPLYQIYHLLNHALLFGGSYADDARRIGRRYTA